MDCVEVAAAGQASRRKVAESARVDEDGGELCAPPDDQAVSVRPPPSPLLSSSDTRPSGLGFVL